MQKTPRVALLVETSRGYGRDVLRGIIRYARTHGPWSFYIRPGDFIQVVPKMRDWGGTGIIARIETRRMAEAIAEANLPTIGLDIAPRRRVGDDWFESISEMHPDPVAATNMAIDHLLDRGFREFAFVGLSTPAWAQARETAFVTRMAESGFNYQLYEPPTSRQEREWGREQTTLTEWLCGLPKPIGLFACNDDRGRQVLEAAFAADIPVPEDLAVVGMDDDDLLCELCNPPLSSVALNAERGGYHAAALLDRMMGGEDVPPQQILVEPLWTTNRQSTDILAIDDPHVAAALRYVRSHHAEPIQVCDVVAASPLSRRSLEVSFRATIRRSVHDEIQRVHLEQAKRLLLETDLAMERVARKSGFNSASYLGMVFRRVVGMTPMAYRTHVRAR